MAGSAGVQIAADRADRVGTVLDVARGGRRRVSTQYRQIEVTNRSVDWIAPTLNEGIPQGAGKLSLKLHTGQLGPFAPCCGGVVPVAVGRMQATTRSMTRRQKVDWISLTLPSKFEGPTDPTDVAIAAGVRVAAIEHDRHRHVEAMRDADTYTALALEKPTIDRDGRSARRRGHDRRRKRRCCSDAASRLDVIRNYLRLQSTNLRLEPGGERSAIG